MLGTQFEKLLEDPISLNTLANPVSLIPCAHKVEKASAVSLFGKTKSNSWELETSEKKICSICRKQVLGYSVDHTLQQLSEILSLVDLSKIHQILRYPGKSAKFEHILGDWKPYYCRHHTKVCKQLTFDSQTKNAGIKSCSFFGYTDGNIVIEIHVEESMYKAFQSYFSHHKITPNDTDKVFLAFTSKRKEEFAVLYKLVSEHNEFPKSHETLIQKIVTEATSVPKQIPYPWQSSILKYVEGNWDSPWKGLEIQRQMLFEASNQTAIIRFFLYGYHDGRVTIRLTLPSHSIDKWTEYLRSKSIINPLIDHRNGFIYSRGKEELRKFFQIISENNKIPELHFSKLKEIVEKGEIPTSKQIFGRNHYCPDLGGIGI